LQIKEQILKKALEARDFITEGHAGRLQDIVTGLARLISLPESKLRGHRLRPGLNQRG